MLLFGRQKKDNYVFNLKYIRTCPEELVYFKTRYFNATFSAFKRIKIRSQPKCHVLETYACYTCKIGRLSDQIVQVFLKLRQLRDVTSL